MKTIIINVPEELELFYKGTTLAEEAFRDARFMYTYIIDGSMTIETVAEMLHAPVNDLKEYYEYHKLPLNTIKNN